MSLFWKGWLHDAMNHSFPLFPLFYPFILLTPLRIFMKTHTPKTSAVHQAVNLALKPAVKAAVASIPSIFVPLSSLFLSSANVRKQPTKTVEENIEELAAMIDAQACCKPCG